ncbi:MAG: guanylate kinase [Omnitrophica bacterium]|nr:guanylate kinase [Candidatus Omnitrophota bacterium]
MKKGRIFVISAPSGSGKTTICKKVLEQVKNITPSVSFTTRSPRKGEKNKEDYHYLPEKEFKEEVRRDNVLEWEENFGYLYGTPKRPVLEKLEEGKDVLLSIDVKGAREIKKKFPKSILIFIKPPSIEELRRRLKVRNTDDENEIAKRLEFAKDELSHIREYDYVVANDELTRAVREVISIIETERSN